MDIINTTSEVYEMEGSMGKLRKKLVHHKGEFYMVSENTVLEETLVFRASPTGDVDCYSEVGGGKGLTLEQVVADFDNQLYANGGLWSYDDDTEDL